MTTPIPPEAITAVRAAMSDVPGWPPYMARSANYPDLAALQAADREAEAQNDAVIRRMLEAVADVLRAEGAAAERDRRREQVIGYKIGGKLYHPADVTIVLRGEP